MDFIKMDRLNNQLNSKHPLNVGELNRLYEEFVIENIYNSNAIEGNSLTLRETSLIIKDGITISGKPLYEHLEVIGHKDAFDYILLLVDRGEILTERSILDIHTLILANDQLNKGVYRKIDVEIAGAIHKPLSHYLISTSIEKLLKDYEIMKQNKHIVEAIAEFHLQFEGIHPFIDGNGRVGRLVLNFELIKAGYLPINIKYLDRLKYYECFDAYYGESSTVNNLVNLIVDYEIIELEKRLKLLDR